MAPPANTPANSDSEPPKSPVDRRPSQGVAFASLLNQKRNSVDAAATARRQSFHDQKPAAGFFGTLWNKYTLGPAAGSK